MESLEDLQLALEAINGDEGALKNGVKGLETHMHLAIARNDTRRQLDLFEKLVEVSMAWL